MSVRISRALYEELIRLAADTPDQEICGLLFGEPDWIAEIQKVDNISSNLEGNFELDPKQLIAAHKAERVGGRRVIGHFHSHPNGRLSPSSQDALAAMGDGALWLIVAQGQVSAWRSDAPGAFQPVALEVAN